MVEHKIYFGSEEQYKYEDGPRDSIKDEEELKLKGTGQIPTFPSISQTPLKNTNKDDRYKNSSYSHLNSVDCM